MLKQKPWKIETTLFFAMRLTELLSHFIPYWEELPGQTHGEVVSEKTGLTEAGRQREFCFYCFLSTSHPYSNKWGDPEQNDECKDFPV